MRVKLVQMTKNPIDVMWVAARTCYASGSPIDMWGDIDNFNVIENEKKWKLVKKVLDSGHQSVAEHVSFTFAIEGISRSCSHQLVRHRHCTFSQQSQRYVEIKEKAGKIYKLFEKMTTCEVGKADTARDELGEILDKYFIIDWPEDKYNVTYHTMYGDILYHYLRRVEEGEKPEDARAVLPNCTKTNLVMTINLRELIHVCNLRLCTRAQKEIRDLFGLIKKEVLLRNEVIGNLLVPSCEVNGFCIEGKCCNRKPYISEVMGVYNSVKENTLSKEDYDDIMNAIKNPKINKALKKLMKMESEFN